MASAPITAGASETAILDAGQLTAPPSFPMQVDNTSSSSNGSLLLLIDLGPSNTINNTVNPGSYVSGTNSILAAGGFNINGGTNETVTTFTISSGTTGDELALRWFPSITYSQYQSGTLTLAGQYFGTYAPSPLGTTPDGGNAWVLTNGGTFSLNFFTTNSNGGGSQLPALGFTNNQIASAVPEPSTYALFALGLLGLLVMARRKKLA